jgi:RHS repeat-associated protein
VALADGSGTIQTEYSYEPFGKTTTSGGSSSSAFAFTGREADGTGLYYYRARYYDAGLQRFIAEDPLGFGGGDVNLHGYVGNAPTNLVDPTGQIPVILILPLAGCLGGAAGASLAPVWGRKLTPMKLLEGCWLGSLFGLPGARPLIMGLRPLLAPLVAPLVPRTGRLPPISSRFGPGTVGAAQPVLPDNARRLKNVTELFRRLQEHHGIDPNLASERLHKIKSIAGLGPADNVIFDLTGGVYHPTTLTFLGSLTTGGAGGWR